LAAAAVPPSVSGKAPARLHPLLTDFSFFVFLWQGTYTPYAGTDLQPKLTNGVKQFARMRLQDVEGLELPPSADMHVHLRQDRLMELVVTQIRNGGANTVFVMVSHDHFRQDSSVLFRGLS
jgi:hypothetical protein